MRALYGLLLTSSQVCCCSYARSCSPCCSFSCSCPCSLSCFCSRQLAASPRCPATKRKEFLGLAVWSSKQIAARHPGGSAAPQVGSVFLSCSISCSSGSNELPDGDNQGHDGRPGHYPGVAPACLYGVQCPLRQCVRTTVSSTETCLQILAELSVDALSFLEKNPPSCQ